MDIYRDNGKGKLLFRVFGFGFWGLGFRGARCRIWGMGFWDDMETEVVSGLCRE